MKAIDKRATPQMIGLAGPKAAAAIFGGWTLIAILFSVLGYVVSYHRGTPQAWWPSLGYTLAVFSIWTLLTTPIALGVKQVEASLEGVLRRLTVYALCLPLVLVLHLVLFVLLYWPIYGVGQGLSHRAMAEKVLLANYDTNILLYVLLLVGAVWLLQRHRLGHRSEATDEDEAPLALRLKIDRQSLPPSDQPLTIRSRGKFRLVPLTEIDWIAAAGNYCEVHASGATHLLDAPLTALAARLPADRFARIHRSALVRLDRVAEVHGLGRGDAKIVLTDGTELRLSRRFRDEFQRRLRGA